MVAATCAARTARAEGSAAEHVEAATALHAMQRYAEALHELEAAYALDPQPRLLYAQGQLHALLGDCAAATTFYERFLATAPSPHASGLAREAMAACRSALPAPSVAAATVIVPLAAPTPPAPMSEVRTSRRDRLGLGLVVGGGILGLVGAAGYLSARGLRAEAAMASTHDQHLDLVDRAEHRRTLSAAVGLAGGLVLAAGVTRLVLAPQPGGGMIAIGGEL